jgi:hypothetical protein
LAVPEDSRAGYVSAVIVDGSATACGPTHKVARLLKLRLKSKGDGGVSEACMPKRSADHERWGSKIPVSAVKIRLRTQVNTAKTTI